MRRAHSSQQMNAYACFTPVRQPSTNFASGMSIAWEEQGAAAVKSVAAVPFSIPDESWAS
ncbi:hypothetical protein ACVIHI_000192 [Bradyrhizobium sp. USDA 4524]|nr:hypothetical protein [Bradyrhizobium sp. USDA 4538]MCP1899005.1 hypothetical protein [Bradyrhizobium sp. USDA 4537]MCP1986881.1 hypothetical protein [Bradyrhizobium sp. USDA 4539]